MVALPPHLNWEVLLVTPLWPGSHHPQEVCSSRRKRTVACPGIGIWLVQANQATAWSSTLSKFNVTNCVLARSA